EAESPGTHQGLSEKDRASRDPKKQKAIRRGDAGDRNRRQFLEGEATIMMLRRSSFALARPSCEGQRRIGHEDAGPDSRKDQAGGHGSRTWTSIWRDGRTSCSASPRDRPSRAAGARRLASP